MSPHHWKPKDGHKTVEVNGYRMAYLERGQGALLVLVHGSLSDYRAWALQMEPFSAGCRTIAVSLRHCFPECWDGEGDRFSVRQHADDLAAFIIKLNSGPVHLVAHSRGGDVALILAAKNPRLVRSMVLVDPAPFDEMLPATPEITAEIEKRRVFITAAIERIQQGDRDGGLEMFTDAVSAPGNWKKLPESAKQMRRDNMWSLKSLVADAQEKFDCADAGKIDAPVLLVAGEKSPRLYGMMHDALQPCLNCRQKVTIAGASHGMNRENPEAFNAAVIDFLGKNSGQPRV
jgi:pimeloyl-ACP methyl ester carboxylesterase